jgi:hypothetical protein
MRNSCATITMRQLMRKSEFWRGAAFCRYVPHFVTDNLRKNSRILRSNRRNLSQRNFPAGFARISRGDRENPAGTLRCGDRGAAPAGSLRVTVFLEVYTLQVSLGLADKPDIGRRKWLI